VRINPANTREGFYKKNVQLKKKPGLMGRGCDELMPEKPTATDIIKG